MGKNSTAFVADRRKLNALKKAGKCFCFGCTAEFVEGDSIQPNSSGSKRYHYKCAKSLKII